MATESAGILSVAVTGDISALLVALDQATQAATSAGVAIAEALTAPSESADFNFGTALATQFQVATDAAETAGAAIDEAFQGSTEQMGLFAEAADTADTSMEQLSLFDVDGIEATDSAFGSLGVTLDDVNASAGDTSSSLDNAGASASASGEDAEESDSKWGELYEQLVEMGEVVGVGLGLVELGEHMVEAVNTTQQLTQSLTFFSGEAETAEADVQLLQGAAMNTHTSFETMAADMQKFGPALGGFNAALPLFEGAAAAANATGLSFDSMVSKLDRMAVSGTANARVLASLQLTMQQLDQATQNLGFDTTFAGLKNLADQSQATQERVQVLDQVLGSFAGDGQLYASTLQAAWTDFGNQFTFSLDAIGSSLAPVATSVVNFAGAVLQSLTPALQAVGQLASASVVPILNDVTVAVTGLSSTFGSFNVEAILAATVAMYGWSTAAQVATAAMVGWDFGTWMYQTVPGMKAFGDGLANLIGTIQNWAEQSDMVRDAMASMGDATALASQAQQTAQASAQALYDKLTALGTVIPQGTQSLTDWVAEMLQAVDAMKDVPGAATAAANGIALITGQATLDKLAQLTVNLQNAKDAYALIASTAGMSGAQVAAALQAMTTAQNAYNAAIGLTPAAVKAASTEFVQWEKTNSDASTELNDALLQIASGYGTLTPMQVAWNAALADQAKAMPSINTEYDDWNESLISLASGGLPQVITGYDDWNAALNKIDTSGQSFATQAQFMKGASTDLANALGIIVTRGTAVVNTLGGVTTSMTHVATAAENASGGIKDAGTSQVFTNDKLETASTALTDVNASWDKTAAAAENYSDSASYATTATDNAVTSFNTAVDAMEADIKAADDLADAYDNVSASATKAGNASGGKGGAGNSAEAVLGAIVAAGGALGAYGAGLGTLSGVGAAEGLQQTGNTSFETMTDYVDQLNESLKAMATASGYFTASLSASNAIVETWNPTAGANTTSIASNTTATAANTTATAASTSVYQPLAAALTNLQGGIVQTTTANAALTAAANAAAAAETTATTSVAAAGETFTTVAGDTGQSYQALAEHLLQFGNVTTDGTVNMGQLDNALASLTTATENSAAVVSKSASITTGTYDNATDALTAMEEQLGNTTTAAQAFATALTAVVHMSLGPSGTTSTANGQTVTTGTAAPTLPTVPEGGLGQTLMPGQTGFNIYGQPISDQSYAPAPAGGVGMGLGNNPPQGTTIYMNVQSPTYQATANQIVSALRNNASLKI